MTNSLRGASFAIPKNAFISLRNSLFAVLEVAGYEPLNTVLIHWRFNDRLDPASKVTVVAYKSGSVTVTGYGPRYDLTIHLLKTYDVSRSAGGRQKTKTRRTHK